MICDVGETGKSIVIFIGDDAGAPVTGLTAVSAPTLSYWIAGANAGVAITLVDLALITTAWTSGGFKELGNGLYRVDLPNACLAAAGMVVIYGGATGKQVYPERIDVSPKVNTVRLNGTAQTARDIGASVLLSPGTDPGQVDLAGGKLLLQASQPGVTIPSVTTVGSVTGNVGGSVASVVGAVTTNDAANIAAIKDKTDNLPANPAAVGSQMDLVNAPNATAIGAVVSAIFAGGSIDGYSLAGVLKLIAAAVIGKVAGLPGTSITQRAINDSKTRLTLTLDADGNITAVTADAT